MYFIKSGTIQMVLKEYNNFPFMYVEQGYFFGEIDLLFGETRKYTFQAKTECELLALNKKNFTQLFFQDFRDVGAEIYNNALKRRIRAQKTHKEALTQCQSDEAKEKERKKSKLLAKLSSISDPKMSRGASGQRSPHSKSPNVGFHANVEHLMDEIEAKESEKNIGTLLSERVEDAQSNQETQQPPESTENVIQDEQPEEKGWKKKGLKIDTDLIEAETSNSGQPNSGQVSVKSSKRKSPLKKWNLLKSNFEHHVRRRNFF